MLTTVTIRLYPNAEVEAKLFHALNVTRRVYNHGLEQRTKAWKRRKHRVTFIDQTDNLKKWRDRHPRIAAVASLACRSALKRLETAFGAFFRRCKAGENPGHPRFKSWRRWNTIDFLDSGRYIRGNKVQIPKVGAVIGRGFRPIEGTQRTLRILRRAGKWFAQVLIDDGKPVPEKLPIVSSVGIDLGLTSFVATSEGQTVEAPRHFRRLEKQLARTGRRLARKQKGSRNRQKAVLRLQRVHARIANARADFLHKLSRKFVDRFDLIGVEALNIEVMRRSRFAKSINDASWGTFLTQLKYKAESAGKTVVFVDAAGTSQLCSKCGATVKKDLSVRVHECACGLTLDRDVNAARNIHARALKATIPETFRESTPAEIGTGPVVEAGSGA